jgi:hypothetical protein
VTPDERQPAERGVTSLRQPVGPHPPATYWRRRATVLAVVLGLLLLTVKACGGSSPSHDANRGAKTQARQAPGITASPTTSGSPGAEVTPVTDPATGDGAASSGSSSGTSAGSGAAAGSDTGPGGQVTQGRVAPGDCGSAELQLVTRTDLRVYSASGTPRLSLAVHNAGQRACRVEVGRNVAELVVTSGPDRVWSSADCAGQQAGNVQLVGPGASVVVVRVTWQRTRSAPGCPQGQSRAKPGTYVLTGNLRGLASMKDVFDLR